MRPLKDFSEAELKRELQIREDIAYQQKLAQRAEENRIQNLPENVAKRQAEMRIAQRERILSRLKHPLTEYGIWEIYGEDPNCDLGGSHHQPFLGKVEGTLEQAVEHALNLRDFFTWGAGGDIHKSKPETVVKL